MSSLCFISAEVLTQNLRCSINLWKTAPVLPSNLLLKRSCSLSVHRCQTRCYNNNNFKSLPRLTRHNFDQTHADSLSAAIVKSLSTTKIAFEQSQKSRLLNDKVINSKKLNTEDCAKFEEENENVEGRPELVDEYLSLEEWRALKEEWKQKGRPLHPPEELFYSRTMSRLSGDSLFQKGHSLMEFVHQEELPLTYPFMSAYLYLCLKEGAFEKLFWVQEWFTSSHSVLDEGVLTNLIAGFCQTSRWRESLKFLEQMKLIRSPSARNYQVIITTACDHQDYNLVEDLLQDLYSHGTCPSEMTFNKLLQTFHCETEDADFSERSIKLVNGLLEYLSTHRFYPSTTVGSELQKWFHGRNDSAWKASMTKVTKGGKCRSCGSKLESLDIDGEDFQNLRHQITEKVIKGTDIFKKTRPDELDAFMSFVNEGAPYDVIVDGLNVAHIKQNLIQPSKMLRQFVVYLAQECGLKCLVLGRQHMLQYSRAWNKHHMDVIQDVTDCFFTENVSEDDPFMLYATLTSGPKACYVSRDMLRDHKALLDQRTHVAFMKWQRGHQMYPLGFQKGKAVFKKENRLDRLLVQRAQCTLRNTDQTIEVRLGQVYDLLTGLSTTPWPSTATLPGMYPAMMANQDTHTKYL